jgi:hypothetical protein
MSAGTSVPEQAARLVERAQKVALCLDFDGTLSPIVEGPQAGRPLPGIVELARRPAGGAVRRRRSRLGPSGRIPG